ncbi:MAG TPA: type II toxin-antitoxin system prevent-host-death family antitoxin [Candidatus Limnocylindrales bacterium]
MYAGERIGVTRNGKLAAVVIGVEDLEALEEFEMAQDLALVEVPHAGGLRRQEAHLQVTFGSLAGMAERS